ncbi:hypothetical protein C8R47DRAFT_1197058, partial [Mycena vitilis]
MTMTLLASTHLDRDSDEAHLLLSILRDIQRVDRDYAEVSFDSFRSSMDYVAQLLKCMEPFDPDYFSPGTSRLSFLGSVYDAEFYSSSFVSASRARTLECSDGGAENRPVKSVYINLYPSYRHTIFHVYTFFRFSCSACDPGKPGTCVVISLEFQSLEDLIMRYS